MAEPATVVCGSSTKELVAMTWAVCTTKAPTSMELNVAVSAVKAALG